MRPRDISFLACPACKADLQLAEVTHATSSDVETGSLACVRCGAAYPIVRHVPRFVSNDNYARGFGVQWTIHSRTQYDSHPARRCRRRGSFGKQVGRVR